jgi:RHS repeat-associated protein
MELTSEGLKLAVLQNTTVLLKATFPLPGGATAVYDSGGFAYFRHPDWLGSSRLATQWDHTIYAKEAYAPIGEPYNESDRQDRSFTGQDQDTVSTGTGLYDFLYRRYHPVQGRWISPDLAGLAAVDPANPQTWNRYAYGLNRPLALIDPTGLCTTSVISFVDDEGNISETVTDDGKPCGSSGWVGGFEFGGDWAHFRPRPGYVLLNPTPDHIQEPKNNSKQKKPGRAVCAAKLADKYSIAGAVGTIGKTGFCRECIQRIGREQRFWISSGRHEQRK